MPATVTPTPNSTSKWLAVTSDTVVWRLEQLQPTATSTAVASVNQTGEAMFGRPFVYKASYTAQVNVLVANTNGASIYRVVASQPVTLVSMTQYHQIVPTNTTVWTSGNTAQSQLLQPKGQGDDVVSYAVAVVADTVV